MATWNDPPAEQALRAGRPPRPFLARILEALSPSPEPGPGLEYDGPCAGGKAPRACAEPAGPELEMEPW
jgi:hypothetical protein